MSIEALKRAIDHCGSQHALAEAIGKRQGAIGNWLHRDKKVPAEACADIERATGGAVKCAELRPDVFRDAVSEAAKPTRPKRGPGAARREAA